MDQSHIIWSGRSCPFRRAGVYYGIAPCDTHEAVARWLLPRRGVAFPGGSIRVRPERPWPLNYFAVRDPSAVRVVPVKHGQLKPADADEDHVSLIFPVDARGQAALRRPETSEKDLADIDRLASDGIVHHRAVFILTVGLRTDLEGEFHRRLILTRPEQPYAPLCDEIMALRDEFSK